MSPPEHCFVLFPCVSFHQKRELIWVNISYLQNDAFFFAQFFVTTYPKQMRQTFHKLNKQKRVRACVGLPQESKVAYDCLQKDRYF